MAEKNRCAYEIMLDYESQIKSLENKILAKLSDEPFADVVRLEEKLYALYDKYETWKEIDSFIPYNI
jgi:hypothetical protein